MWRVLRPVLRYREGKKATCTKNAKVKFAARAFVLNIYDLKSIFEKF